VGQQLAREGEAKGLPAIDPHRRQAEVSSVRRKPCRAWSDSIGARFSSRSRSRAMVRRARRRNFAPEISAGRLVARAHPLDHASDTVVLRAGAGLHFSPISFRTTPLDGTGCFLYWAHFKEQGVANQKGETLDLKLVAPTVVADIQ